MKKLILFALTVGLIVLPVSQASAASRQCESAVRSELRARNTPWWAMRTAQAQTVYVIDELNAGRLTNNSAIIYLQSQIRRYTNNRDYINHFSSTAMTVINRLRRDVCK